jgi:hypothetical protein
LHWDFIFLSGGFVARRSDLDEAVALDRYPGQVSIRPVSMYSKVQTNVPVLKEYSTLCVFSRKLYLKCWIVTGR